MRWLVLALASLVVTGCVAESPDVARASNLAQTMDDPEAARVFAGVLDSIAPDDGWARTRYLEFDRISGAGVGRTHRWDRFEGDYLLRAQTAGSELVARFNVNHPTEGQEVWMDGERVTDPDLADELAVSAYRMFINDTYWLVFPFKWDDPGVTARYLGEMEQWGETFEVVELTFDDVGMTPQNRYRAFVDPESGMFELWQYFANVDDEEPRFTQRWGDWRDHGPILLSATRESEDGSVGVRFENMRASADVPAGAFDMAAGSQGRSNLVAFTRARIFDGTGAPVVEDGVVVVRDGVIAEVGTAAEVTIPDDAEIVDLEGRWLLPGFVNAHGHVNSGGDRSSIPEQLEIYAHYGVTTVLSLGDDAERPDERFGPELERARLFVSGPSLSPSSTEEAEREVERVAGMDADWVKSHVVQSRGQGVFYADVIAAARERSLPAAIHVEELEDAKDVVRVGASMLAHSVRDEPVDDELIRMMLERDVCLVPTFTRELSTFVYAERPDFFDDPFFLERSAPENLDAFLTPQRRAQAESASARYWKEALPLAMENMRRLHEAGVRVAMGTDTGPAGRFQGYFEHVEMEMMADAGLTREEVLLAATGEAARCIGLDGVVGTVRPGVWADVVVLNRDPLEDVSNTREIHGVWIAGNRIR